MREERSFFTAHADIAKPSQLRCLQCQTIMKNLKISTRISLGFCLVFLLFFLLIAITIWHAHVASASAEKVKKSVALLTLAERWQAAVKQNSARSLAIAFADDTATLEFFKESMAATSSETTDIQNNFLATLLDAESKARADEVGQIRKSWLTTRDQINAMKLAGDVDGARTLVKTKFVTVTAAYIKTTQALVDGEVAHINIAQNAVEAMFQRLYIASAALAAIAVLVVVLVSKGLSKNISLGIDRALNTAICIGAGDLSQHIDISRDDEIGKLLNALDEMRNGLLNIVLQVHSGTDAIAATSREIASGNSNLASRTQAQASSLEQIVTAMQSLIDTVKTNADNARQTSQLATAASEIALKGGAVMDEVVGTMASIDTSSRRIVDIISVIDGIAFQTNILALNAAVEAARAGEQGRGFAVVATEVRNLAQRSAAAAKEIKMLISDSVGKIADGSKLVGDAGVTMEQVVQSVQQVRDIMHEVDAATQEQRAGIDGISTAIVRMDAMTQQNATLVEQAAVAAGSLQEQAAKLFQVVSAFELHRKTISSPQPLSIVHT